MSRISKYYIKLTGLIALLPFVYGCGGAAGTGSLVSFLFGGSGSSGSEFALLGSAGGINSLTTTTGAGLATLHQPEPASMMLLGGGLMAMGYFKSKANNRKK